MPLYIISANSWQKNNGKILRKLKKTKKRIRECELINIAHLKLTFETNREIHIMLVLKKVY